MKTTIINKINKLSKLDKIYLISGAMLSLFTLSLVPILTLTYFVLITNL